MNKRRLINPITGLIALIAILIVGGNYGHAFADSANTVSVDVFNFGFSPDPVTINVGDTVEWTNTEGFHNVAATNGGGFSNSASSSMWVFSHTFNSAGTFTYQCDIHPGAMQGTVTVQIPSAVTMSDISATSSVDVLILPLLTILMAFGTVAVVKRR